MFSFLNKNSESKTLPTPEEAPADQVMQEIEAMQLDDSPGMIYCIVISDHEREAIYSYIHNIADIYEENGVQESAVEFARKCAGRFAPQPDEEIEDMDLDPEETEAPADETKNDLDPAYLFDKPVSNNKW